MLLLVGLGNPTPNSNNNRHNIGFKVVDAINQKFGLSKQKPKFKGLLTTGNIGEKVRPDCATTLHLQAATPRYDLHPGERNY